MPTTAPIPGAAKVRYAAAADRHLKKADPVLSRLIAKHGPCGMLANAQDTFEAILESITYQQLNGKAAATIHGRVLGCFGGKCPAPADFLGHPDKPLREAGLSANKLLAIRDLARKSDEGIVPRRAELEALSNEEIIERLTQVRGVGVWTAQMFLMFNLGRPDVLPTGDFGIRKAFGLLFRKSGRMPPPSAVEKHGQKWAPYRTVASWYLWRSLD